MRLPVKLPEHHPLQKMLAACLIAAVSMGIGLVLWSPIALFGWVRTLDNVFYDSLFRMRGAQSVAEGEVVIVAVDDQSIAAVDQVFKFGWPWPREYYGYMVKYLEKAGAKVVAFDLLFDRSSVYNSASDDDNQFAEAINGVKTPVVFATVVRADGSDWGMAPAVERKVLAAANISSEGIIRQYSPVVHGRASLALEAVKRAGGKAPEWAGSTFLLHYYGPHEKKGVPATFRYVRAGELLAVAGPKPSTTSQITPELFKGKIVLIGTITAGTYDLKSSPLASKYPGVEVHATAIQNMLADQRVEVVGAGSRVMVLLAGCFAASLLTVLPGRVPVKLTGGAIGVLLVLGMTVLLFLGKEIRWLPPAAALLAAMLASFSALGFSYFTELRQRQFILKMFAQSVSKEVADEIAKDPRKAGLGGRRREMTVMFTDLANFTTVSEQMEVEKLAEMLHIYLEEMSGVILSQNGTLDKYIGDAIMSFWNAPADQSDHARRACQAALEMRRREDLLQPKLMEMVGKPIHSRIGINSGPMIVGNMGSTYKFAYTVLGDSVNLASRLEGANKMYGTRIIISETTAIFIRHEFVLRKVDALRVKGKLKPMEVFELIAEGSPDEKTKDLIVRYEHALSLYQNRHFDRAHEMLIQLAQDFPEDGPTATLLGRVLQYQEHPPDPGWDGVYVAKDK